MSKNLTQLPNDPHIVKLYRMVLEQCRDDSLQILTRFAEETVHEDPGPDELIQVITSTALHRGCVAMLAALSSDAEAEVRP